MNTLIQKQLVDELIEAYVDWREACARVDDSYRTWASEPGRRRRVEFGLYMAALAAEEQAAEVYAGLVRRANQLFSSEEPRLEPLGRPAWGTGWP